MIITLEGSSFTRYPITFTEHDQFTIQINGQDIHFQALKLENVKTKTTGWDTPSSWKIVGQQIQQLKVRTEEEKAAEESVAKAKDALKAAENTLKAVREKL